MRIGFGAIFAAFSIAFVCAALSGAGERAAAADAVTCDDFLPRARDASGKKSARRPA